MPEMNVTESGNKAHYDASDQKQRLTLYPFEVWDRILQFVCDPGSSRVRDVAQNLVEVRNYIRRIQLTRSPLAHAAVLGISHYMDKALMGRNILKGLCEFFCSASATG